MVERREWDDGLAHQSWLSKDGTGMASHMDALIRKKREARCENPKTGMPFSYLNLVQRKAANCRRVGKKMA